MQSKRKREKHNVTTSHRARARALEDVGAVQARLTVGGNRHMEWQGDPSYSKETQATGGLAGEGRNGLASPPLASGSLLRAIKGPDPEVGL